MGTSTRLSWIKTLVAPLLVSLLAVTIFLTCYQFDNKYTTNTPQARNGLLTLTEESLEQYPVIFLIEGWHAYSGLSTPAEIDSASLQPIKTVAIGQYTGLNFGNPEASPHGSATLSLTISLPEEPHLYALEIPEIYSSYWLYVNNDLVTGMGDPSNQAAEGLTGNRTITFMANGTTQITLAMSDYSHIYSGLVYPPSFGEPDAVQSLLSSRIVIRTAVIVFAGGLALFYLAVGLIMAFRKVHGVSIFIFYGLLCLCFVGYTCYPVVKTLTASGLWWYTLESFCYCAMLLLVMSLQMKLCEVKAKIARAGLVLGGIVCVCALFTSMIGQSGETVQRVWSNIIQLYFIFCAAYLTLSAIYGIARQKAQNTIMLCGALVFDVALIIDRVLPDHEPILTGWFTEWAGLVLVICMGILIAQSVLEQDRKRQALEDNIANMQLLMDTQMSYYPFVIDQAERTRAARHDLRHHLVAIRSFSTTQDFSGLTAYLEEYESGADSQFAPVIFCEHPILNMQISNFSAQIKDKKIRFVANLDMPQDHAITDPDLFVIVANLLENAQEATMFIPESSRSIEIRITRAPGSLIISVDNSFDGQIELRGNLLLSRKRLNQEGIGTASVRKIAQSYQGSASYRWEQTEGGHQFSADVILPYVQSSTSSK